MKKGGEKVLSEYFGQDVIEIKRCMTNLSIACSVMTQGLPQHKKEYILSKCKKTEEVIDRIYDVI